MLIYAGVGSRETPLAVMEKMTELGRRLAKAGWWLRSGAAEGADEAFEKGCDKERGGKEIFLPWPGFNHHQSGLCHPTQRAMATAQAVIPWWDSLSDGSKKLHARNAHQVFGYLLDSPVDIVICWTPKGKATGGTRTAIMLAAIRDIPVLNMAITKDDVDEMEKYLLQFGQERLALRRTK